MSFRFRDGTQLNGMPVADLAGLIRALRRDAPLVVGAPHLSHPVDFAELVLDTPARVAATLAPRSASAG